MLRPMKRGHELAILLLILAMGAPLRFAGLARQSLRVEEAWSLAVSRTSPAAIVERCASDVHPPGHLLLLHAWAAPSPDEAGARSLSAAAGLGAVALVWAVGRLFLPPAAALGAAALAAVSPYLLWYAQEARVYSLLLLATLAAAGLTLRLARGGPGAGRWIALALVNAAGLYLHYFFACVLLFEALALWPYRREAKGMARGFLLAAAGTALLYSPWVAALAGVVGGAHGWSEFEARRWALTPVWLGMNFLVGNIEADLARRTPLLTGFALAAFGLLGAVGLRRLLPDPPSRRFLAAYGAGLFAAPLLLSAAFRFALGTMYFIGLFPAVLWLAASGATAPRRPALRAAALAALLAASLAFTGRYLRDPDYGRADWRGIARTVEAGAGPGEALLFYSRRNNRESFDFYYRGDLPRVGLVERGERIPPGEAGGLLAAALAPYDGVWFVSHFAPSYDPGADVPRWLGEHWRRDSSVEYRQRGTSLWHFTRRAGGPAEGG